MKLKDKIGKPIIFAFIFTYTLFFPIGQAEGVHFGIIDAIEEKLDELKEKKKEYILKNLPDLTITTIDSPAEGVARGTLSLLNEVENQGGAPSGAFYIYFYLSKDTTIDNTDIYLGKRYVSHLSPGESSKDETSLNLPSNLTMEKWYIGVIVDPFDSVKESREENNTGYDTINIIGEAAEWTKILKKETMDLLVEQVEHNYYFDKRATEIGELKEGDIIISTKGDSCVKL